MKRERVERQKIKGGRLFPFTFYLKPSTSKPYALRPTPYTFYLTIPFNKTV